MLLVKYFLGEAYKLRGFLMQIKIKITNGYKIGSLCRIILDRKGVKMV